MHGRPPPIGIGYVGPLIDVARRIARQPTEILRIARRGPRLYAWARSVGASRAQAVLVALVGDVRHRSRAAWMGWDEAEIEREMRPWR